MRLYHFALFFLLISSGFFVTAKIEADAKIHEERVERAEYECLVAAVNATVDVVFSGEGNVVTEAGLKQAEEVFFQTLAVLHKGTTDRSAWKEQKEKVPLLAVFDENGYYRYCYNRETGYEWSQKIFYEDGNIPNLFFEETAHLLTQFYNERNEDEKKYCMEQADEGVWQRCISPPCVFAVYSPFSGNVLHRENGLLYAASERIIETYLVTEDKYCHLPFCNRCETQKVTALYTSQRECAKAGAIPCEFCLR